MDIPTAEANAKWQKSNSAIVVVGAVALAGFLVLLALIGIFNIAVPFWVWFFFVPLLIAARVLQSVTRWRMLRAAETAYDSNSTMMTDETLAAAQKDYRAKKRQP